MPEIVSCGVTPLVVLYALAGQRARIFGAAHKLVDGGVLVLVGAGQKHGVEHCGRFSTVEQCEWRHLRHLLLRRVIRKRYVRQNRIPRLVFRIYIHTEHIGNRSVQALC